MRFRPRQVSLGCPLLFRRHPRRSRSLRSWAYHGQRSPRSDDDPGHRRSQAGLCLPTRSSFRRPETRLAMLASSCSIGLRPCQGRHSPPHHQPRQTSTTSPCPSSAATSWATGLCGTHLGSPRASLWTLWMLDSAGSARPFCYLILRLRASEWQEERLVARERESQADRGGWCSDSFRCLDRWRSWHSGPWTDQDRLGIG